MKKMLVALVQFNAVVGDMRGNCTRMLQLVMQAQALHQVDLVVFPELALCGYPPEDLLLRAHFLQQCEVHLRAFAKALPPETVCIVGYPRQLDGRLYNAAAFLADGRCQAVYHKHSLPNYGVFDEKRYFTAGDAPLIVDCRGFKLGLTVCEDVWESAPVALAAAQGAELIVNINASPYHLGKQQARYAAVAARCRERQLPVLYVNLVGGQDEVVFDGASFVMDATGERLYQAPQFTEQLVVLRIENRHIEPLQASAALLEESAELYAALVLAVRDYVHKNGFQGAVIGLSGGVDSALTLALAVDALGAEHVEAVMMPSRYTSAMSLEDAAALAANLGVKYQSVSIESVFAATLDAIQPVLAGLPPDVTEENIQARCRGMILMAISNKKRCLLLTTGNKSELAVGYATLYGDMAGGFAPLKDVSKTWVYRLCHYRNRAQAVIPARIMSRPPSAELAPEQKDEDSLPPYDVLDRVLQLYIEEGYSVEEIVAQGFPAALVKDVIRKINLSEYKRRQAAPGVKVSKRAFGRERRYPITSAYDKAD